MKLSDIIDYDQSYWNVLGQTGGTALPDNDDPKEINGIKGIVVIEEHNIYCGVGSILARIISEKNNLPMRFVGIIDSFCSSGKREDILESYGLNTRNIIQQVEYLLNNIR